MVAVRLHSRLVGTFVAVLALITSVQPVVSADAATTCTISQLEPTQAQFMVTQGVGDSATSATPTGYVTLTRGKDTLAKLFLTLPPPSLCSMTNKQSIKITGASITVSSASNNSLNTTFTSFVSTPSLPATIQPDSPADPIFVVPASNLAPLSSDGWFSATFTATVTYSRTSGTTTQPGSKPFSSDKTFERQTNALRVYLVPMGDASQPYNNQYTETDQTIVQNAMQTLSRIYPTPAGIVDLAPLATGGIRYVVDTATMLDLKSVSSAYVTSGGATKFCGTSVNFSAIKGLLAQYLLTHNNANPLATADRVVGVVGGNSSPGGRISFGSEDGIGCADGMASVSSAESWIRLVADQPANGSTPAKPSRSGALAGMEISHTFSLDKTSSYHSSSIQSDSPAGSAAPGNDRAYDVSGRSRVQYDHSVMNYNNTDSPWNNNTTLLEPGDFAYLLCQFAPTGVSDGFAPVSCTTSAPAANIGSSEGVSGAERYVIAGTTDGTARNTSVVEPYFSSFVAETPSSDSSPLRLIQLDSASHVAKNFGVPWSPAVTHEGAKASTVQTFYAAASGFTTASGEVRLVKVDSGGDDPLGSTAKTLFSSQSVTAPTITSFTTSNPPSPGGMVTLGRSQFTARIPPKPDIVFLADTTGSMGTAIENVRTNIANIMSQVTAVQPDALFAAASYKDNVDDETAGCTADLYVFRIEQPLTATTTTVQNAIANNSSGWQATGGCDDPESQLNALYRLGIGNDAGDPADPSRTVKSIGYRAGSSRVIAWFGDQPGHDPSNGHTLADAIARLRCGPENPTSTSCELGPNSIRVVAVDIGLLDSTEQATTIADATGGVVKTNNADQVSQAILEGLQDLSVTVTPQVTAPCDSKLSVSFSPTSRIVTSGTRANFAETVTVAEDASSGIHTCKVQFLINGQVQSDPAFTQIISIDVGGTQQQYVSVTAHRNSDKPLLLDLIYKCASFNFVAAVAVQPTTVTTTEATFNANADTSAACAKSGGGGTLVAYVSDGWNRFAGAGTSAEKDIPSSPKAPTAAIYRPTIGASIRSDGTLALRGSGEVAGKELQGSALRWSLIAPSGTPPSLTPDTGNALDVPAPPGGWIPGIWTARLHVTADSGTDDEDRQFCVEPCPASFGAAYEFVGYLNPVSNPPIVNSGIAGKTFALKWQLKSGGTLVRDTSTVVSTLYAAESTCDPMAATNLAKTSGGSLLKFDPTTMQFVFNWQTPSQVGLYLFRLTLSDGSTHDACVNLTR